MKNPVLFILSLFLLVPGCNMEPVDQNSKCLKEHERKELNKQMVTRFYQELFGNKNIDIIDKYVANEYIQHNPMAADGRQALKDILRYWFANAPKDTVDIRQVIADGDLVMLHVKSNIGGKPVAVVDIFRIEGDSIAEHWDVVQAIPDSAANDHPMF